MRYSIIPLAVVTLFTCSSTLPASDGKDETLAQLERARTLYKEGKLAEAMTAVEALRKALPPEARLTRWSIDFQGRAVPVVLIGKKHLYFTTTCSRREKPAPPALPDDRALLDDKTGIYDFNTVITCVDAASGKKLWTRQTPGLNELAIDPRNDSLYVWREKLFRLKPENGEVDQEKDLPGRPNRVEALIIAGRPYVPRPQHPLPSDDRERMRRTYNVDTGETATRDVLLPGRLAPDESRTLVYTSSFIEAKPLKELVTPWKYAFVGTSYNEPLWLDDDVIALNGDSMGKAEIVRLKGADGAVKWRFPLPRGAFGPGRDQLPGNAYPERTWCAAGMCGEHLLTIGGEGSLYFLDPATGKLAAKASPSTTYLAFPRIVEGALVVCGIPGVRAIPMDVLLNRRPASEKDVILLQAKCLATLGKSKEALTELDRLLEQDPEYTEGWAVKAELSRKADRPLEEIAARCRHLELTGQETSPELRERWGLIKRIATRNDITMDLKRVGDTIYCGTWGGWLHGIDVRSLEVEKKEFPSAFGTMVTTERLKAYFTDGQLWRDLAEHGEDRGLIPAKAPAEWHRSTGYDGRVVRWQGKYYRPLAKGNVRVLDGDTIREVKTQLGGIHQWQIDISPAGPIGYGNGGVYELDKDLCPVRNLFQYDNVQRPLHVALLASDAQTFGLFAYPATLQVWTRDGKKKLAEVTDLSPGYIGGRGDQLIALGGGYLLSAGELAWASASPGVSSWRFGFGDKPGRSIPKIHYAHSSLFGRPLLCNNLLFVTCRDGGIYVFDVNAITGRRGD